MDRKQPSVAESEELLRWADAQNPGPWYNHSLTTGYAARKIAERAGLDAEKAQAYGLLHDIGRYEGVRNMHHIYAGYLLMMEKGWPDAARICITHSFPVRDLDAYIGTRDVTEQELREIISLLENAEYDDYDSLIQFCDAICMPQGVVPMETRMFDVIYRYGGLNDNIMQKWRAYYAIKERLDALCECNVFSLFSKDIDRYCSNYTRP